MVTIKEFLEAIEYRICEGSPYMWDCFGSEAQYLDSFIELQYSASMIFDRQNQTVYCIEVHDYCNNKSYRLLNPEFKEAHDNEAKQRGVDRSLAWDDHKYVDLETDEDMLEKLTAIVRGEDYDDRVILPIDLPKDQLYELMRMAHERDMTFNDFVMDVVQKYIDKTYPEIVKEPKKKKKNRKIYVEKWCDDL